jgi:hypothetical protein
MDIAERLYNGLPHSQQTKQESGTMCPNGSLSSLVPRAKWLQKPDNGATLPPERIEKMGLLIFGVLMGIILERFILAPMRNDS